MKNKHGKATKGLNNSQMLYLDVSKRQLKYVDEYADQIEKIYAGAAFLEKNAMRKSPFTDVSYF